MDENITRLLIEWREGSQTAQEALLPLVYDELHRMAMRQMSRERQGHTLQPTALLNEAWVEIARASKLELKDRSHFLALAARVMRQVLVHYARRTKSAKRGGGVARVELNEALDAGAVPGGGASDCDLLALDQALAKLAERDERKCRVVELKFFGGLTEAEIAEVVGIAVATVRRDLQVAKAFLLWQMTGEEEGAGTAAP